MVIPKPLKPGDTVAIIGVAGCVRADDREVAVREHAQKLEALGYRVHIDPSAYSSWGYLAGTDQERADAFMHAFEDDSIQGIWCVRGGYGCIRILDLIDWDMIRRHPKVFVGYSDVTALHTALHERCDLCTFHGPMVTADQYDDASRDSLLHAVSGVPDRQLINPDGSALHELRHGIAEGILVGGNLSLIASTIGTPYELDTKDHLLFLEDVGEAVYIMDRYLQQLRLAGKFDGCAGLILGGFTHVEEGTDAHFTMHDIIDQLVSQLHVPVLSGLQAGHMPVKLTLPLGRTYRMNTADASISLLH